MDNFLPTVGKVAAIVFIEVILWLSNTINKSFKGDDRIGTLSIAIVVLLRINQEYLWQR